MRWCVRWRTVRSCACVCGRKQRAPRRTHLLEGIVTNDAEIGQPHAVVAECRLLPAVALHPAGRMELLRRAVRHAHKALAGECIAKAVLGTWPPQTRSTRQSVQRLDRTGAARKFRRLVHSVVRVEPPGLVKVHFFSSMRFKRAPPVGSGDATRPALLNFCHVAAAARDAFARVRQDARAVRKRSVTQPDRSHTCPRP